MNILKLMSLIILVFLAFSVNATQYKFVGTDNSFATKVCVFAGTDNKLKLKRAKQYSFDSSRAIANSVRCNDMSIGGFAKKYHAMNTFKYLNKLTNAKNRDYDTKVEIQDLTAAVNDNSDTVQVIYVSSAK